MVPSPMKARTAHPVLLRAAVSPPVVSASTGAGALLCVVVSVVPRACVRVNEMPEYFVVRLLTLSLRPVGIIRVGLCLQTRSPGGRSTVSSKYASTSSSVAKRSITSSSDPESERARSCAKEDSVLSSSPLSSCDVCTEDCALSLCPVLSCSVCVEESAGVVSLSSVSLHGSGPGGWVGCSWIAAVGCASG